MTYYDWPPRYPLEADQHAQRLNFEKIMSAMLDSKLREVHGKLALIENKIDSIQNQIVSRTSEISALFIQNKAAHNKIKWIHDKIFLKQKPKKSTKKKIKSGGKK